MNRPGALVTLIVVLTSGCGAEAATVHSRTAQQASLVTGDVCRPEYLTLATAVEAYLASTGALPASEGDLVAAGLLREDVEDFDVIIADNAYEVVAAGDRCEGFDPSLPDATESEPMSEVNCAVERTTMETAWEAYSADHGTPPVSEADLVPDYLHVELAGFDLVGAQIEPVPGVCG
jgi:hypothetical protein